MKSEFYIKLEQSTAHRSSRDAICKLALEKSDNLEHLVFIALDLNDKNHYKACWALELVLDSNINLIFPYLEEIIEVLPLYKHDGALRSMSKIVMFIAEKKILTDKEKIQKLTNVCFLWMVTDTKVVTKCYAGYALKEFGKNNPNIIVMLKEILEQDYDKFSPAYQAMARYVFK